MILSLVQRLIYAIETTEFSFTEGLCWLLPLCPKEMRLFPFADAILVCDFHICPLSPPPLHTLNLCDLVKVSLFLIPLWQKKARASWGHLEGIIMVSRL